jgi:phosphotransferase system HPr-like phosphotransfer protein
MEERLEEPEIKKFEFKGKKGLALEAVIQMEYGFILRTSWQIVDHCQKYEKDIYFSNKTDHEESCLNYANAKNVFQLITLAAYTGDSLWIFVEGRDDSAKKMALSLYSGISSREIRPVDFSRFEKNENP